MKHAQLITLRRHVRETCADGGIPVEERARLVLAITLLAEPVLDDGGTVDLEATVADRVLTIGLRLPAPVAPPVLDGLPQPAAAAGDGRVTWRFVTGDHPVPASVEDEQATRQEMLALTTRADTLAREHRYLRDELAETNSGVLAMYVELEQRDEQLRHAHARIFQELEDALRPPPLNVPGLELGVRYSPTEPDSPTGGDLYDWFVLPSGHLHVTLVDAVGHGVTSTRDALTVTHAIRTLALEGHPFPDLIAHASHTLATINPLLMATVLLARIDPATGHTQLANGGHPEPVLVGTTGDTQLLDPPVIGRGVGFPNPGSRGLVDVTLAPGATLLLYTDGLVESRKDIDEGQARLLEVARTHAGRPTAALPREVVTRMHDVVTYADDTVLLAIRRSPAQRSSAGSAHHG
ncbi:PP2C family protein-serine/threonine phosphatase [Amycolatopsis sp., V23-08]|uniref:PP2C family protein-serine/threonine phosphatase n=1 Tax=Amycolatopsis heterodermiae TaxID=3110235 RepID=A0ABU5R481_9PSEU|nr:PP2C family protein-serine/threonine phosphatase [Amycolatopsis sp., V23-08]MEA5361028.1 PP2C family protein-serine/threonine phosphatase [Amycolatopsis sp., V23-08]